MKYLFYGWVLQEGGKSLWYRRVVGKTDDNGTDTFRKELARSNSISSPI
jgi:hypothetical protein